MEKKYKISEFATILGITPKTVYRMIEREELKTVIEKVNNRQITIVVATDDEIKNFRNNYSKDSVNVGNYEDILTDNIEIETVNEVSQTNNNANSNDKALEILMDLNDKLNIQLAKVNDELIESKSKQLLLAHHEGREGYYLEEINGLRTENRQLMNDKDKQFKLSMIVIFLLSIVIVCMITFNVVSNTVNNKNSDPGMENNTKIEKTQPVIKENLTTQPNKKVKR